MTFGLRNAADISETYTQSNARPRLRISFHRRNIFRDNAEHKEHLKFLLQRLDELCINMNKYQFGEGKS
jgi:hypothetical protein